MLETRQLHATLAREVVGLRLWEHLNDATVSELRALYAKYGVLVFRRQALSETELVAFCALFGQVECTVRNDWASPITPEVTVVSNLKDGHRGAWRRRVAVAFRSILYAQAGYGCSALCARTAA